MCTCMCSLCLCACACVFISSVQMGGRVPLAAKRFSMLMSCYLWRCRNNILSPSQWGSSLLGADYTAPSAKVVIYIFTLARRKHINAHRHIYTCLHTHIYACNQACIHTYGHTHGHTHTNTRRRTLADTHTCAKCA